MSYNAKKKKKHKNCGVSISFFNFSCNVLASINVNSVLRPESYRLYAYTSQISALTMEGIILHFGP